VPKRFLKDKVEEKKKTVRKDVDESKLKEDAVNLVEVDESRAPASLVFVGHVDAGKSTICGNLMLLTGMIDERIIRQY